VIDAASRRPQRLEELVQCVFSADEVVRMRASDALVRLDDREQAEAVTIVEHNLDTSGDWIVINLTLRALATFARTSPAVRTRLTGRLHHYQDSPYKSVASRARKLLADLGSKPPAGKTRDLPQRMFTPRSESIHFRDAEYFGNGCTALLAR
jgi:hypothetical protein